MKKELKKISIKLHKNAHHEPTRHYYQRIRRKYKQLIRKNKSNFRETILHKMETLNSNNPQAFWKLYN